MWSLIQSLLGAEQATIPHLKEEIVSFQGTQNNWNFPINRYNLSQVKMTLFQHGVSCSHLYQHTLTLWSVTMQPLAADLSTIPHMEGDIHIFHLRYGSMICTKRLQSYGGCKLYARTSLVILHNYDRWKNHCRIVTCGRMTCSPIFAFSHLLVLMGQMGECGLTILPFVTIK